jgi:hypothetical protein
VCIEKGFPLYSRQAAKKPSGPGANPLERHPGAPSADLAAPLIPEQEDPRVLVKRLEDTAERGHKFESIPTTQGGAVGDKASSEPKRGKKRKDKDKAGEKKKSDKKKKRKARKTKKEKPDYYNDMKAWKKKEKDDWKRGGLSRELKERRKENRKRIGELNNIRESKNFPEIVRRHQAQNVLQSDYSKNGITTVSAHDNAMFRDIINQGFGHWKERKEGGKNKGNIKLYDHLHNSKDELNYGFTEHRMEGPRDEPTSLYPVSGPYTKNLNNKALSYLGHLNANKTSKAPVVSSDEEADAQDAFDMIALEHENKKK